jgi:hypothetical protein
MKAVIIIFLSFLIMSCASHEDKRHSQTDSQVIPEATINDTLRQLVLTNANQINAICDSIIISNNANDKNQKDKSIWMSTSTVFTEYAPNILGEIAAKAGDSTECVVIEVTVYNDRNPYNDRNQKNSIMISAEDSSCSKKLNNLNLKLDSTERFIFGVNRIALQ